MRIRTATAVAAVAVLLAACGDSAATFAPAIDTPTQTSAAYPWNDVESVRLSVAHAGAAGDLKVQTFARDQPLDLTDIPAADDLVVHLSGLRGQTEIAYGRSCPVAVQPGDVPDPPHIYFARIVRWAAGPTPGPTAPLRTGGAAYTAPDGSGVFLGGDDGETTIDRFDALHGAFVAQAGASAARRGAVVAPLPDGSALRIGGADDTGPVRFYEHIVLATGEVERGDTTPVVDHAAATLVDGTVVVMGGRDAAGAVTGATWTFRLGDADTPAPPEANPPLATPRALHTATRLGDDVGAAVLVVGGQDAAGAAVAAAEMWEPLRVAYADFHPRMVTPRWGHRAARLPDGSILVVGGRDAAGPVATIELYMPRVGQFVIAAALPANAGVTDSTVTELPDGRVLIAGGKDVNGNPVTTTIISRLDPIDGTVDLSPTDPLATPRAGHAATLLCDGTILLVGGTTDPAAPTSERYNPPSVGRR